jgi:hypothetical protein
MRNRKFIKYSSLSNVNLYPVSLVHPLRTFIELDIFNGSLQPPYFRSVKYQDICEGGILGFVEGRSSF